MKSKRFLALGTLSTITSSAIVFSTISCGDNDVKADENDLIVGDILNSNIDKSSKLPSEIQTTDLVAPKSKSGNYIYQIDLVANDKEGKLTINYKQLAAKNKKLLTTIIKELGGFKKENNQPKPPAFDEAKFKETLEKSKIELINLEAGKEKKDILPTDIERKNLELQDESGQKIKMPNSGFTLSMPIENNNEEGKLIVKVIIKKRGQTFFEKEFTIEGFKKASETTLEEELKNTSAYLLAPTKKLTPTEFLEKLSKADTIEKIKELIGFNKLPDGLTKIEVVSKEGNDDEGTAKVNFKFTKDTKEATKEFNFSGLKAIATPHEKTEPEIVAALKDGTLWKKEGQEEVFNQLLEVADKKNGTFYIINKTLKIGRVGKDAKDKNNNKVLKLENLLADDYKKSLIFIKNNLLFKNSPIEQKGKVIKDEGKFILHVQWSIGSEVYKIEFSK